MNKRSGPGEERFPSTHWSAIFLASQLDRETGRRALDDLLKCYLPALKTHVKTQFMATEEQCEDWLQSFVLNRILEKELLRVARPERGRFRTLLLTALNNFVVSQLRYQNRQKRHPPSALSSWEELTSSENSEAPASTNADFDRQWAQEVIRDALERMKSHCQQTGRRDIWEVFYGRYVGPILHDAPVIAYETLATRFGLTSPVQAANFLTTGKRMFQRTLRVAVAEYAANESDIDAEIKELMRILAES